MLEGARGDSKIDTALYWLRLVRDRRKSRLRGFHTTTSFREALDAHRFHIAIAVAAATVPTALRGQDLSALETKVKNIIADYHGEVGVAVEHIESGRRFAINGHTRYPLASVYKTPIMVEVFRQAKEGRFSLEDRITVTPEMYHPWGPVMSYFQPGLQPTVRDLVFWMMVESDNLATEILLEKVGAENVRATLKRMGLNEVSVDRSTKVLILDYYGYPGEANYKMSNEELQAMMGQFDKLTLEREELARRHGPLPDPVTKYNADPRDTGSPLQINELFIKIFRGEVVSREASREMIDIMLECRTGDARIKGMLPPGTPVAHKTGGWPTSNNNAGIIYLPDEKGHLAVTVLDNNMNETFDVSSKMIARIARAAYDFFVPAPSP